MVASAFISTDELQNKLVAPNVKIVDASWHMASEKRDAFTEYKTSHIPGAVFFDIDEACDKQSPYPHMLPTPETFAKVTSDLGIANQDEVIIYDSNGLFSAPRVWWMFRVFGHDNVKILNGGLPKWLAENRLMEAGDVATAPSIFTAHFKPELLRDIKQMQHNLITNNEQVIDARLPARFAGTEPEPRAGLLSGHIPHSVNVHYKECIAAPSNTIKPAEELRALFASKNIDLNKPITTSCGSGITACILAAALYELGINAAVYDGSWAEWGSLKAS